MDKVVHFEVPFDDGERATTFYREAFGWRLDSMPQFRYTMVGTTATDEQGRPTEPGAINGGMLHRQGPITAPVITVGVEDIDDALARIEKLGRSEEHTSELQSRRDLVCRLLLEKKKQKH